MDIDIPTLATTTSPLCVSVRGVAESPVGMRHTGGDGARVDGQDMGWARAHARATHFHYGIATRFFRVVE